MESKHSTSMLCNANWRNLSVDFRQDKRLILVMKNGQLISHNASKAISFAQSS